MEILNRDGQVFGARYVQIISSPHLKDDLRAHQTPRILQDVTKRFFKMWIELCGERQVSCELDSQIVCVETVHKLCWEKPTLIVSNITSAMVTAVADGAA